MTELLDLSTIVERNTVRIRSKKHPAGKLYELLNRDDLGVFEHAQIVKMHTRASQLLDLANSRNLKPVEQRELSKALRDVVKLLMPGIEPVVLRELSDTQLAKTVAVWAAMHQDAPEGNARSRPRTGGGNSRVSKRSTAATRNAGGTSRSGK